MTWLEADAEAEARYRALDALDPGSAVARLIEALSDASWRVRRLAANRLAQVEPTPEVVRQLVALLGRRGDTGARNAASTVLAQLGTPALPAVIVLLQHDDPDQRKFAADILGELGRPEAVPSLVGALRDVDANVRTAAAEALGRIGGMPARRALEQLLGSADPLLRVCGLEGLARMGTPPPLPVLGPMLDDALTRPSAFRLLGLVPHPTAWRRATTALKRAATRDGALLAFAARPTPLPGDVEAEVAVALRVLPDVVRWLDAALLSNDLEKRRGALTLARALRAPQLALSMARAVGPDGLAEQALDALVHLGLPGARALLDAGPMLADLPGEARAVAGEAILSLAEPALVDRLSALLVAGDAEWAELGARALGRTRAPAAIAPLAALFDDDALAVHAYRALVALAGSWPEAVRAELEPRVQGPLKPHVVRAWAEVVGAEAQPVLQRALHDERDDVRAAAVEAAVAVLDASTAPAAPSVPVLHAAGPPPSGARAEPAHGAAVTTAPGVPTSSAERGGQASFSRAATQPGAVALTPRVPAASPPTPTRTARPLEGPALVRAALMDESPRVRRAATRALAVLPVADAGPLLSRALIDADATVLALACQAAARLPGIDVAERLRELARHADAGVALSALDALAALGQLNAELLLHSVEHPGSEVVRRAFELGADQPQLVGRAEAALAHPRWDVRAAAARLLAVAGGATSLEPLRDALERETDDVARELLAEAVQSVAAR